MAALATLASAAAEMATKLALHPGCSNKVRERPQSARGGLQRGRGSAGGRI